MKENVKIKESIRIVVRDKESGKTVRDDEYPIEPKKTWIDRILGREGHATMTDWGLTMIAALLGNVSSPKAINQIGAWDSTNGTWNWQTSDNSTVTDKLKVNNSLSTTRWSIPATYSTIGTRNSGDTLSGHWFDTIGVGVFLGSNQEWWAEIQFSFS